MYHAETDTPACARTSNLNEELGQVKYVFSDKTGTLTQNVMEFQQCSVGGTIYSAKSDVVVNSSGMASSMVQDLTAKHSNAPYIREFLTLLAVCHTVIPEKDETNPEILHYHAASPGLNRLTISSSFFFFYLYVCGPYRLAHVLTYSLAMIVFLWNCILFIFLFFSALSFSLVMSVRDSFFFIYQMKEL